MSQEEEEEYIASSSPREISSLCGWSKQESWNLLHNSHIDFISNLPSVFTRKRCITASFSSGLNEQVEYTRRPPTDSISTPRRKIRNWILQRITDNFHQ